MTPEELRTALETQPVPDHRPGFWDDLGDELGSRTPASGRRAGWLVAVAAASAVIAVTGVAALLIRQAPFDALPIATEGPDTSIAPVSPTTEPVAVSTSQAVPEESIAPWDRGLLSIEDVPSALTTEWRRAENQLWCSAIYPTDIGVGDADLRRAEFSGGWALAWDLPDLRSAFGVAGVGSPAWEGIGIRMPDTVSYGEQVVGYGGEGFDDAAVQRMAEFSIPGQLCGYQVWSKLGDEHLVRLVDSLRLVDGLTAEPIDTAERPGDRGPEDRGSAPWAAPAVAYPDGWPAAPTETLPFVPTSGVPSGAAVRTTTEPMWSLAWDAPDGPGHDSSNHPCRSCGRGVVGLSVSSIDLVPDGAPDVRWSDGSVGFVVPRVGDPGIPIDRLQFRAPESDELVPGAPRIDIFIPDLGVVVSLWSHLGIESLFELVDGLRLADPGL